MARQYKVTGTNDFLYFAIGLLAWGLWSVRDGWFPTQTVLKRHPLEVVVPFEIGGQVEEIQCAVGHKVSEKQPLVQLKKETLIAGRDAALAAYDAVQSRMRTSGGDPQALRAELEQATQALGRARADLIAGEVLAPVAGRVLQIDAVRTEFVDAGDPAVRLRPTDSFYLFNKSMAILSFLGALACAIFHLYAK